MLAHEPADAAAQSQSGDAGRRDHAAGRRQAVNLRLAIEQVPCQTALRAGGAGLRIDMNTGHRRQVDHHAAVGRRAPRHIVAATANGDLEVQVARQLHGIDDVAHAAASRYQRRPPIDQPVMNPSRVLIIRIGRQQELPSEGLGKFGGGIGKRLHSNHGCPRQCIVVARQVTGATMAAPKKSYSASKT